MKYYSTGDKQQKCMSAQFWSLCGLDLTSKIKVLSGLFPPEAWQPACVVPPARCVLTWSSVHAGTLLLPLPLLMRTPVQSD